MLSATYASAADESTVHENVTVIKDGVTQDFTVTILSEDGCTFAPMRAVFEMMNAKLTWDGARNQIRTSVMGNIILSIGSKFVMVGGNNGTANYILDGYPRIYNDSTMVPLTFLRDALNIKINYAETSNTLVIITD